MLEKPLALLVLLGALVPALALAEDPAAPGTLGEECDPAEPAPHTGVVCLPAGGWTYDDSVVLNARKGDLVLNSACGLTAAMVNKATQNQQFSHVGIMIEDRRRIRHARVKLDPFEDSIDQGGGDPNLLRFGWPGVLSQTIHNAFEGTEVRPKPAAAPETTPSLLQLDSHFGADPAPRCEDLDLTAPLVLRPPPEHEESLFDDDETVRSKLHRVADEAIGSTGHYRFYAFTEAAIHGRSGADPGADALETGNTTYWEDETGLRHHPKGMQCASFIWHAAQTAGVTVDDGLPHETPASLLVPPFRMLDGAEAEHGPDELRGLYVYPEAARHRGITFLGSAAEKAVSELVNTMPYSAWFAANMFGVARKVGHQVQYCFGFDECANPLPSSVVTEQQLDRHANLHAGVGWGDGLTVSPGDMTHWDSYPDGVWGATDLLRYRPGVYRQKHRWAASSGSGVLNVVVFRSGAVPGGWIYVEGAVVILPASAATPNEEPTDSEGFASFPAAAAAEPPGPLYELLVSYWDDWTPVMGGGVPGESKTVKVKDVPIYPGLAWTLPINLDVEEPASGFLCPPDGLQVDIGGTLKLIDGDWGPDDVATFTPDQFLYSLDGSSMPTLPAVNSVVLSSEVSEHQFEFGDLGVGFFKPCVDEVMTDGLLTLMLNEDPEGKTVVEASLSAVLYEGWSGGCGYNVSLDDEDTGARSVVAAAGEGAVPLDLGLISGGGLCSGCDFAVFHLTVEAKTCFPDPGSGSP